MLPARVSFLPVSEDVVSFEEGAGAPVPEERRAALAAFFDEAFEAGRAAWPSLGVSRASFVAAIARHARAAQSSEPVLLTANAADYTLAIACAEETPGAAEALQRTVLVHVPEYVGSRGPVDDVMQLVAMR